MQTFLPYPSFKKSVQALDYRRLGKQRVEGMQILNVLLNPSAKQGWKNHPAVLMWKGYEHALKLYVNTCIEEWISRGYNNNMPLYVVECPVVYPPWYNSEQFHSAHRSNLLRKDPKYYGQFHWVEPTDLPYYWPTHNTRPTN